MGGALGRDVALLDLLAAQQQTNALLQAMVSTQQQTSASVQTTSSKPSTSETLEALRAPDDILEVLMAAQLRGEVDPFFQRMLMMVPAGTQQSMLMEIPQGKLGYIVGVHRMQLTPDLTQAQITHIDDDSATPLVDAVSGIGNVSVAGPFFRPVRYSITHIVRGDPDLDVQFVAQMQGVYMSDQLAQQTLAPMWRGWYAAMRAAWRG